MQSFDPDAVIINLGQNDYGLPAHIDPKTHKPVKTHLPSTAQWTKYYTGFVGDITQHNKGKLPQFFLACGGMADKYCNNTEAAVNHMKGLGQQNMHFLDITGSSTNVNSSYMGCASHPSWLGHQKAAELAHPLIRDTLRW